MTFCQADLAVKQQVIRPQTEVLPLGAKGGMASELMEFEEVVMDDSVQRDGDEGFADAVRLAEYVDVDET